MTGNFKSKGMTQQMIPLLIVSVFTSLVIAFAVAVVSISYPDQVFGLLTNHLEVSQDMTNYTIWLLPVLVITAIAFILEGYFIGLKEGATLRNAVLLAFVLGFMPIAIAAWYFHNNHLLWATIVSYMTTIMVILGVQVPRTFTSQQLKNLQSL
ncbi:MULTISPECIES: MATE family efflux transporter [Cyanophyceae]|uniref:MATE family efflux transporter n=1 Tax=Cyanophyceae TaxID=3028117 RepID=UPI00232D9375|nr:MULTISPECIES: MATE family efflux transporter [Cyanophyceae]MDB9354870.1 MATE family efflux transporter [Nodularia spumigena CS-587/03]MDB9319170.1 MATE family efflux transporter [Nodularia spumigena CS-590/01A]MDB9324172.1 MATE family efflux transporter [Nodularia spumigena CS-591/07A]MDB9333254.1 MATE family efflux transporter [Nodularia spumigena CS-591/04]MDB9336568.1 MATE family efflux transporter [Nodularia spumigena CS-590/01]